ncbi:MAG TPA: AraC family transcriptional regulator, partial [Candidatus Limnocylindrales bacterium]|nr:AraC family transcriptional regulator [Candidatus Limnocylindrales bacterium]
MAGPEGRLGVPDDGPPFTERPLLAEEWFGLTDVRCVSAPPVIGRPESATAFEIVFPLDGAFIRTLQRRRRSAEVIGDPAHALFFRPGEVHRIHHPIGGSDRSVVLTLSIVALDLLGIDPGVMPDSVPTSTRADLLLRAWLGGLSDPAGEPIGHGEIAVALVDAVVGAIPGERPVRDVDPIVNRARLVVADSLAERLTLPELGRRVGASPFHLARRFRRSTGLSIHAYRTTLRVRAAIERVAAGER